VGVTTSPTIELPVRAPSGPVFVHSDALATRHLVPRSTSRVVLLNAHLARIEAIAGGRDLWFPAFNYGYPKSGVFDVRSDVSELGPISEYFRTDRAQWRTRTPMFSAAGIGARPRAAQDPEPVINPFGPDSIFASLCSSEGTILWYGAPWPATTIIHFAEACSGGPLYRYDKDFPGEIVEGGQRWATTLRSHVRPLNRACDYAWSQLFATVVQQGIVHPLEGAPDVCFWVAARDLVESWVERLAADPLALLDTDTRAWVAPMLERLGRRFELRDFEVVEEALRPRT
jgi:aminoglycoside N3'-acetyltransferase